MWATGVNKYGQLGTGNTNRTNVFVQVLSNIEYVACGARHTIAMEKDGVLWVTGNNSYGQLGTGDTTDTNTFIKTYK